MSWKSRKSTTVSPNIIFQHFKNFTCDCHSLFQNEEDKIYGTNRNGECGLGHSNHPQITPSLPNLPSNIIQFVCGNGQNLFLD